MSGKEATTHRTTDWPWDVPLGLVGHQLSYPIALAFAASLTLRVVDELATPTTVVITTLGLVPVVAAAWLLSTPLAIGVTVLGIGLVGVAAAAGGPCLGSCPLRGPLFGALCYPHFPSSPSPLASTPGG